MKKVIVSIFLFILSIIFCSVLTLLWIPLNWVFHLISFKFKTGFHKIGGYFYQMALSIDQFANVSLQIPLNYLLLKKYKVGELPKSVGFRFGDEDDTISHVIAVNYTTNGLSKFGMFWAKFLNAVDKGHLDKTIVNKKNRDLEAWARHELRIMSNSDEPMNA